MKKNDLLKVPLNRKKIVFLICVALTKKEFRKDSLGCYELMVHILGDNFSGFQIFSFFPTFSSYQMVKFRNSGSGNPCTQGFLSGHQICHLWHVRPLMMALSAPPPQIRRFSDFQFFTPPPQSEKVKS